MSGHRNEKLPKHRYLDRELAWLDFNNRVLDLARDAKRIPLLERVKFLAIFSNNLDEFFMVRVAGLKRRIHAGVAVTAITGARPGELHTSILERARRRAVPPVPTGDPSPAARRGHRDPHLG